MQRIQKYNLFSTKFESLSNEALSQLLEKAVPLHVGIDGKTFKLKIDNEYIFVKKIPLAEIEINAENSKSTANNFELPLFCQYGIGAPGFGSWRELNANQKATQWVLSNECENFSLLYHWRLLTALPAKPLTESQRENLEMQVQFWENSTAVRRRFEALQNPVAEIVMLLEFVPQTLKNWIKSQYEQGPEYFVRAIDFTEKYLYDSITFMNDRGLIHFDAHFENIMTDGQRLYFNDFGLAMSFDFDLNKDEIAFLKQHKDYDKCRAAVGFMHAVITSIYGDNNWKENLKNCLESKDTSLHSGVIEIVDKYAPLAIAMLEFSQKLKTESKRIPFPEMHFNQLISNIEMIN